MKKIIALMLALLTVCAVLAACGQKTADPTDAPETTVTEAAESDLAYITDKGTLVVGITDFEPMDYKNADGEWIGFDADMAKAFAEYLGVEIEFSEIDWNNKAMELDSKTIDCVWNGMTLTDDVKAAMSTSVPYCNNAQVVVVKAEGADKYVIPEDCEELSFAVENGSAGMEQAEEWGYEFTEVADQATALMEVAAGTADAAIIDSLMAAAMVGEGTAYEQLAYTVALNSEEYGVGFRKGSDVTAKFNEFFAAALADGSAQKIAEEYGVQAALIK